MSEIVESYQEEQQIEEPKAPEYSFATIGGVYDDGLALIFPGAEEESEKHYRANLYCKFAKGQRVYLAKDSGTYVVLFPIGVPGSKEVVADWASSAATATKADSATTANSASKANTAGSLETKRTISLTGAVTGSGTFDGSQNVTINTTASSSGGTTTATNFTGRHTGTSLAFFNQSARGRISISKLNGTTTTATITNKLNELIGDLVSYGLLR